jgi:hypothetical protein
VPKLPVSRWTAIWLLLIAAGGFAGAYWGSTRVEGTDAFRSAIVGSIVGGAFALIGGLAGAIYVGGKDDERESLRERRNLVGAVREVRNELTNIIAATKAYVGYYEDHGETAALSIISGVAGQPALAATRYGTHSFVLTRDLPADTRLALDTAYERLAFMRQTLVFAEADKELGDDALRTLRQTQLDCETALSLLTHYLKQIGDQV